MVLLEAKSGSDRITEQKSITIRIIYFIACCQPWLNNHKFLIRKLFQNGEILPIKMFVC